MKDKKIMNYILIIYLLIQPLLDLVATTNLNLINIVLRGLFLIIMLIYLVINKYNKKLLLFLIISAIAILTYNYINSDNIYNIISSTMKLYYLPVSILFFYNIDTTIEKKYLLYTLSTYLSLFLLSYIFGFGYNTYQKEIGKEGFSGIFNSINELSAIIIGLFPVSLSYLKENKKIILQILLIISTLFVSLLTGTKVLMLGLIITIIFIYYKDIKIKFNTLDKKEKLISSIIFIILILLVIYLLQYTRFYKNMVVQNNFFKVNSILSVEFLDTVIFNKRLTYLSSNFNYFIHQDILKYIFGIGYFNILKLVEIDIFDIFFRYGLLGLIIITTPLIFIFKNTKLNNIQLYTIIFLLLISLTSGHVLLNPNVLIYFGYILKIKNESN